MSDLLDILAAVSDALLVPVVVILLLCAAALPVLVGRVAHEAYDRFRFRILRRKCVDSARCPASALAALRILADHPHAQGALHEFTAATWELLAEKTQKTVDQVDLHLARVLDGQERRDTARIDRWGLLVRVGPMLGLMGTLIPMGPALRALAGGDLGSLSQSLVVAFTTTVLGLLIGIMASVITVMCSRWCADDLADVSHLAACLTAEDVTNTRWSAGDAQTTGTAMEEAHMGPTAPQQEERIATRSSGGAGKPL